MYPSKSLQPRFLRSAAKSLLTGRSIRSVVMSFLRRLPSGMAGGAIIVLLPAVVADREYCPTFCLGAHLAAIVAWIDALVPLPLTRHRQPPMDLDMDA